MSDSEFEGLKAEVASGTEERNWMGQQSLPNIDAKYSGAQTLSPLVRTYRIQ